VLHLLPRRRALADLLATCDEVWIPLIVLGESKAGFMAVHNASEALLQRLMEKPTVGVLLPGGQTAEHYARVFVQLKRAGTPVPDNDLWIAALEHDRRLITRDGQLGCRTQKTNAAPLR